MAIILFELNPDSRDSTANDKLIEVRWLLTVLDGSLIVDIISQYSYKILWNFWSQILENLIWVRNERKDYYQRNERNKKKNIHSPPRKILKKNSGLFFILIRMIDDCEENFVSLARNPCFELIDAFDAHLPSVPVLFGCSGNRYYILHILNDHSNVTTVMHWIGTVQWPCDGFVSKILKPKQLVNETK